MNSGYHHSHCYQAMAQSNSFLSNLGSYFQEKMPPILGHWPLGYHELLKKYKSDQVINERKFQEHFLAITTQIKLVVILNASDFNVPNTMFK